MKTTTLKLLLLILIPIHGYSATYRFTSDGYLKGVEMNTGDTLIFKLKNGQDRTFILLETSAEPLFIFDNPELDWMSGIVYRMDCKLLADGQELRLEKIVSAQQSYYEPWHINGVSFFLDAVKVINEFIKDNHGSGNGSNFPVKDARFAFVEYEDDFSSQPLAPWYPNNENFISIKDSYNGADTWLGGYRKTEAHNGFDVNIPNNTSLWAPIDFDDQYFFNAVARGDNNNRWMGIRNWPNGEIWILRTHHMTSLEVDEHVPVKQGSLYGKVGGVWFGDYPHVHFYFIMEKDKKQMALDPWMIFWKIFENNKKRSGMLRAVMNPLQPVRAGEEVLLDASASKRGIYGPDMHYCWSVNDGASYEGVKAVHKFRKEGMHVVTLTVTDGADSATVSQHISVGSGEVPDDYLRLSTSDPFDFKRKITGGTEIYGREINEPNNILHFFFRQNTGNPVLPKEVIIEAGERVLGSLDISVDYIDYSDWLKLERNGNRIKISLLKEKLSRAQGTYRAKVRFASALTGIEQSILVEAKAPDHKFRPADKIIVDDREAEFFPSVFYWVEDPYDREVLKGYGTVSFWGGGSEIDGIARYRPGLSGGKYKIYLHEDAVFEPGYSLIKSGIIHVQIMTVDGIKDISWDPSKSTTIGSFDLYGGKESYLDILTGGSTGQIYLDALVFEKMEE